MRIDQSRYNAFWTNPERYRQYYVLNRAPKVAAYGLSRGTAFHTIADYIARTEYGNEEINEVLRGIKLDVFSNKQMELPADAIDNAWVMWNAYESSAKQYPVIVSEHEFEFAIEGSPHTGVGRFDRIVEREDKLWVQEFKTAYFKANYDRELDKWEGQKQADFEILGARALGYDVQGVLVQYVIETTPPKVWMPMEIVRSDNALQLTKLYIHQTCEIIEMLLAAFPAQPWPHLSNWPCVPGKCEYEDVCGRADVNANELVRFKEREEHLALLRAVR